MKPNKWLTLSLFVMLLISCKREDSKQTLGYAPIYGSEDELRTITLSTPQALQNGGKIFVQGNMLYQVESGRGIHITDISNPSVPVKKAYLKIPGSQEVAVKNGLIYTNHLNDLVVLEINGSNINTIKRIPAFKNMDNHLLPPERGFFECPDKNKGTVIGWQKKMLINPKCEY